MPKFIRAACAAVPLALLSACGSAATPTAASPAATGPETKRKIENIIADCMKGRGFQCVPFVAPPPQPTSETAGKALTGDYPAMLAHRQKQGYGVFAIYVYPQELGNPMVEPDETAKPKAVNPNNKIIASLSKSQYAAYRTAEDRCYADAVKQVTGKRIKGRFDRFEQAGETVRRTAEQELDGDAELVELAAATASCLKAKGYSVPSTKPTAVASRGRERFEAVKRPMGEKIPDDVAKGLGTKKGERYEPNLTAEQARPYLDREVKDALDDLACGKDFYAAFLPAEREIEQRVHQDFGL
ncbi:hypothetical protein DP939_04865 [Spongiactinospora rosea]|uniref:Lipoprotein n=1 Tax=Spongiactinospora rosea TaxID=2248750 RepID=A0A366M8F3_9ACTN|nr:hypothetical protein [Spongiactinospora rosea]RBQ22000.1 hypothetical protein DP939_04865 [Spongiactinospora rosea]